MEVIIATSFCTLLLSQLWCGLGAEAEEEESLEDSEHERNWDAGEQLQILHGRWTLGQRHRHPGERLPGMAAITAWNTGMQIRVSSRTCWLHFVVWQVSFTPNGVDMRMLQPCSAPLRRHFLPAVKVEYSVSPRQSAYRVQIHRIQVIDATSMNRVAVVFKRFTPILHYECRLCCIPRLWVFVLSFDRSRISFPEPSSPMCSTL